MLAKTGSKRKRTNSSRGPPNRLSGEFSGKGKAKATASPVDIDHSFPPSVSHILDPDSGLIRCICSNTVSLFHVLLFLPFLLALL